MEKLEKLKVGELLVQEGLITHKQLEEVLERQNKKDTYQPVGEMCVNLNFISKADLNKLLKRYKKRIQLGDLLVNMGLVTQKQIEDAINDVKAGKKKLGKVLVEHDIITESSLVNALSLQLGIPKIVPDINLIDRNLQKKLNMEFMKKNEVIPAFKEENVLTVIMADPLDETTIVDLEKFFKCQIDPAIAMSNDILKVLSLQYNDLGLEKTGRISFKEKGLVIGDKDLSREAKDDVVRIVNFLISNAIIEEASDIHIEPRESLLNVRYRIDGILQHKTDLPMSISSKLTSRIKVLCGLDIAEKRRHQDGRIDARILNKEFNLRVSTYASMYGESIVIRILRRASKLINLDRLGFSPLNLTQFKKILDYPSGIVLATGPTGTGKTTTLYAALNYLNDGKKMIITVEDPIEYAIDGVIQGQLDTKIGHTYMDFLKSMMRQDPDIIMIGEIRDKTGAEAAVQTALTGHKVLSTFHTDDTTGALLRLMDMGIDTFLISSTVVSVVAQRLVRVLCEYCKKQFVPSEEDLSSFNGITNIDLSKLKFYEPQGCSECSDIGFKGRTSIHELLVVNDSVRDAILKRKPSSQIRTIARKSAHLISMVEDGFYKAALGITSLREVIRIGFFNESDSLYQRPADELLECCEEKGRAFSEVGLPIDRRKVIDAELRTSGSIVDMKTFKLEREVYQVQSSSSNTESKKERIEAMFQAYQECMKETGQTLEPDLLEDFIEFILSTVKRYNDSMGAKFVDFYFQIKNKKVVIFAETLLPEKPLSSTS